VSATGVDVTDYCTYHATDEKWYANTVLEPFQCPFNPSETYGTPSHIHFPNAGVQLNESRLCADGVAPCTVPYGVLLLPSMGDAGLGNSFSIAFDVEFYHLANKTSADPTMMMSVFPNDPDEVIQMTTTAIKGSSYTVIKTEYDNLKFSDDIGKRRIAFVADTNGPNMLIGGQFCREDVASYITNEGAANLVQGGKYHMVFRYNKGNNSYGSSIFFRSLASDTPDKGISIPCDKPLPRADAGNSDALLVGAEVTQSGQKHANFKGTIDRIMMWDEVIPDVDAYMTYSEDDGEVDNHNIAVTATAARLVPRVGSGSKGNISLNALSANEGDACVLEAVPQPFSFWKEVAPTTAARPD
jgi:hypothetical protein